MKVLNGQAALLSNFEVLQHLSEQKTKRSQQSLVNNNVNGTNHQQNVRTIEFECLSYLRSNGEDLSPGSSILSSVSSSSRPVEAIFEDLVGFLSTLELTKGERLQIVNLLPGVTSDPNDDVIDGQMPTMYAVIEDCDERFSQEMVRDIMVNIRNLVHK